MPYDDGGTWAPWGSVVIIMDNCSAKVVSLFHRDDVQPCHDTINLQSEKLKRKDPSPHLIRSLIKGNERWKIRVWCSDSVLWGMNFGLDKR